MGGGYALGFGSWVSASPAKRQNARESGLSARLLIREALSESPSNAVKGSQMDLPLKLGMNL